MNGPLVTVVMKHSTKDKHIALLVFSIYRACILNNIKHIYQFKAGFQES